MLGHLGKAWRESAKLDGLFLIYKQAPGKPHRLLYARIFPFVTRFLVGRLDLASLIEGHRGVFGPHSSKAMVVIVDDIR